MYIFVPIYTGIVIYKVYVDIKVIQISAIYNRYKVYAHMCIGNTYRKHQYV